VVGDETNIEEGAILKRKRGEKKEKEDREENLQRN
jgi:hypothetical protein